MDNDIIPQNGPDDTSNGMPDFDEMLRQFSADGNGETGDIPPDDEDMPPDEDAGTAGDAAPSYWRRQFHTLSAFLQRPSKEWLVDSVLGAKDFVLLYGESGHGKTHAVIDLAFSCVTGRTFANTFAVARPLSVAYCTGEGADGLADRLRAVVAHYGTDDVQLYPFPDIPQLFQANQENGALAFIREWQDLAADGLVPAQLDVLILDTLHNATAGADENSAKDAGLIQATMRKLRDTLGCAIILVHHAGKNGASERGSSAIRGNADTVLRATKIRDTYTLACEKLKDLGRWPAQAFSLVCPPDMPDGVRVSWDGEAKTGHGDKATNADRALTFLQERVGERFTATDIAEALGIQGAQAKNIYRDLKTLKLAGSVREEYTGKGSPARWYCVENE